MYVVIEDVDGLMVFIVVETIYRWFQCMHTLQFPINIVMCTCCVSMLQVFISPIQIFIRWLITIGFPF